MALHGTLKEKSPIELEEGLKASFANPEELYPLDMGGDYFWILISEIKLPWEFEEQYEE